MAQINGGVIDGQAIGDGPQIQSVARAAALEAMEGVGVGVNAEATRRAVGRSVQRTGAALLTVIVGAWHEAEQGEDLGDGDGLSLIHI